MVRMDDFRAVRGDCDSQWECRKVAVGTQGGKT